MSSSQRPKASCAVGRGDSLNGMALEMAWNGSHGFQASKVKDTSRQGPGKLSDSEGGGRVLT